MTPHDLGRGDQLVLPDYGGACLCNVVPAIVDRATGVPAWMPPVIAGARHVVLLLLDGLGWAQLEAHRSLVPNLSALDGEWVTTVAPSTTATALTSLTVGRPPGEHGIMGYRLHAGSGVVLNVLRWRTDDGDARSSLPPHELQPFVPFDGAAPVVVTRAEFGGTGFSLAHLRETQLRGWSVASSIAVEVRQALAAGEPLVYAYYDGIDRVAHAHGLGEHYRAELRAADRLVGDIAAALPDGAVLVVTADHGHVDTRDHSETLDQGLVDACVLVSGEARFRWLHARPGSELELAEHARERYGELAIVRTRDQIEIEGWFGDLVTDAARSRLGDVAIVATRNVAYLDPTDPGEPRLESRHGALTAAEMLVPLLAMRA